MNLQFNKKIPLVTRILRKNRLEETVKSVPLNLGGVPFINLKRDGEIRDRKKKLREYEKENSEYLMKALRSATVTLTRRLEKSGLLHLSSIAYPEKYQIPEEDEFPQIAYSKITLLSRARDSDIILSDQKHYGLFDFKIVEGANSRGGVNQETKRFNYSLYGSNKKGWDSYQSFVEEFARVYNGIKPEIRPLMGEIVDYVLLMGKEDISQQPVLIEMGKLPETKETFKEKYWSRKSLRKKKTISIRGPDD